MKKLVSHLFLLFAFLASVSSFAQMIGDLIPNNTVTHEAVNDGNWRVPSTWNTGTVPGEGAIVYIPVGKTVTFNSAGTPHIFAIKVAGEFIIEQTNASQTTSLTVDTFIGTMSSFIKVYGDAPTDGKINVVFEAFDIEGYKASPSAIWNSAAMAYYKDNAPVNEVIRTPTGGSRYNSYAEALAGDTAIVEGTPSLVPDGIGVLGRYQWDPRQLSLGLITMGQVEIIGQEKLNMIKLAADALRQQKEVVVEETPTGWLPGDQIVVTRGGNINAVSNGEDQKEIDFITGNTITMTNNLNKNHIGRPQDDLHCYIGNLTRNITFSSANPAVIDQRGHIMAMHNDTNIQIKNAAFVDLGRTDKSKLLNDVIWDSWRESEIFKTKYSAISQRVVTTVPNPVDEVTNTRGRYSIHLHKTGAAVDANPAIVSGNVVWKNPGWGITHHDSHAFVDNNVVYEVTGAGIVSETGSETGRWNDNLVVDIRKGHTTSPYTATLFHDDYLFSGQGLGMKGRAVICDGNVVANANEGIGIMNMNPSITNTDKLDPLALAQRPGHLVDNFPLSVNGYSSEGDGVMPIEAALIFNNTTLIGTNLGIKSIERDNGVNHESRSVFNNFKVWGTNQGLSITYQADYSFKDLFISGRDNTSLGMYLWKHSHNHLFDGVKFADLEYAIEVSKLVQSGNGALKTRNNGVAPWIFIDLEQDNVGHLYKIELDDNTLNLPYDEHTDNTVILSASDVTTRPLTYTIPKGLEANSVLDRDTDDEVDYAAEDFRFTVDAIISDHVGTYKFGVQQALAQGTLRLDYPQRIYEFASKAKFDQYIAANGVYKNPEDETEIYFIIEEFVPDRYTYETKGFPNRIKILNPSSAMQAMAQFESPEALAPTLQLVSRFGTANQKTTKANVTYLDETDIDVGAHKAIDGSNNGHINAQYYQRGELPVGSFSQTKNGTEEWWDLELTTPTQIEFIDIWNTVELNGEDMEPNSNHFKDFYVLIAESSFANMTLQEARDHAIFEDLKDGTVVRKHSINNIGVTGQYIRIQKVGTGKIQLAEVEVLGIPEVERCLTEVTFANGAWTPSPPDATTRAIITTNYNTGDENASIDACEIIIEPNVTLTVTEDRYINVENDITVEGTLTVKHQGSVVQVNPIAQVIKGTNGQINVEVTTPFLKPRDFMVFGSPMDVAVPKGVDHPIFQKIKHLTENFEPHPLAQQLFPNGTNFTDNNFDDWAFETADFQPGRGYFIRPQASYEDGNTTYDLLYDDGILNNGDIRYNLVYNELTPADTDIARKNASPNMIANPYASAIDAQAFIDANNAVDEIYLWEHNTTPSTDYPGGNTENFNMADISVFNETGFNPASTGAAPLTNGYLASMQGFGIKNNGSQDFVTFSNTMRRKDGNTTLRSLDIERNSIWLNIKSEVYDLGATTLIGFHPEATPYYDARFDSKRLGTPVSIFSHIIDGTEALAIQGRETFHQEIEVLLGFSSLIEEENSPYTISIHDFEGSTLEGVTVYLKDHVMDITVNLSKQAYHFTSGKGTFNQRFTLMFKKESLLDILETPLEVIQVYPNPVSNVLTINSPLATIEKISIIDIRGSVVYEENAIDSNQHLLSVASLQNAMYFVQIITDEGAIIEKVLKN